MNLFPQTVTSLTKHTTQIRPCHSSTSDQHTIPYLFSSHSRHYQTTCLYSHRHFLKPSSTLSNHLPLQSPIYQRVHNTIIGTQNQPVSQDSLPVSPNQHRKQMDAAPLRPQPTHHMTKRPRNPSSSFDQVTPHKMQESVSNPSTATEAPEPKKKRGRPPSSHEKTPIHKRQKTASSPPATLKRKRHYRSPSPIENSNRGNAHSEPLIPRTRLLKNLVNVFGNLVDVLESIGRNRNADQGDGVIALIYDPDVFGRAEQRLQSLGDYSADPIDLTSNNEAPIPQQVLDEVGEPGSVNSAIRANWEEVKMITQVLNDMVSQLIRATANPTAEEENAPVASVKEAAEAVCKDYRYIRPIRGTYRMRRNTPAFLFGFGLWPSGLALTLSTKVLQNPLTLTPEPRYRLQMRLDQYHRFIAKVRMFHQNRRWLGRIS